MKSLEMKEIEMVFGGLITAEEIEREAKRKLDELTKENEPKVPTPVIVSQ